jgi:prepilin-type N-terminal cleavage/methylation domain-containing protein
MKMTNLKSAFTLIELLVVIVIIGVLSTVWVRTFNEQIKKSRDTIRLTDINALRSWIEQFYQDRSYYPIWWRDWIGPSWSINLAYVPWLAIDPRNRSQTACVRTTCWYIYRTNWTATDNLSNSHYEISTWFENAGNLAARWIQAVDGWDDDNRLELMSRWAPAITTSKAITATFWNSALSTTSNNTHIHIWSIATAAATPTVTTP